MVNIQTPSKDSKLNYESVNVLAIVPDETLQKTFLDSGKAPYVEFEFVRDIEGAVKLLNRQAYKYRILLIDQRMAHGVMLDEDSINEINKRYNYRSFHMTSY